MKKKIIITLLALTICISLLLCFYWPMPIVKDVQGSKIDLIVLHLGAGVAKHVKTIQIEDYNEEEILEYLNVCKERRSIFAANPKPVGDMEIEIIIRTLNTPNNTRHLILGSVNYGYNGDWIKYKILNAEEVKARLKEILNFDSYSIDNQ